MGIVVVIIIAGIGLYIWYHLILFCQAMILNVVRPAAYG